MESITTMTLRFRFLVLLVPAVFTVWAGLFYGSIRRSEATILETLNREGFQHGATQAREFQVLLESCRRSAKGLSLALEHLDRMEDKEILFLQDRVLEESHHLFGTTVALLPEATRRGAFAPYAFRGKDGGIQHSSLANGSYRYPDQGWFQAPLRAHSGIWSDPYFDAGGGNILMTTYSTPIWSGGRLVGVATVDVGTDYLNSRLEELARGHGSLAFVLTEDLRVIGPSAFGVRSGRLLQEQGMDAHGFLPELRGLVARNSSSLARLNHPFSGKPSWVLAMSIPLTEGTRQVWTLVAVFPEEEMLRDLTRLRLRALMLVGVGLALLVGVLALVLVGLARPIENLVVQAERYATGNYTDTLDERRGFWEIRHLSTAFNRLGRSILEQLETVRTRTIEKERYQSELEFASEIQQWILPRTFPPFPDLVDRLDLYGTARPAREMGGDFFDFIRLGPDRIAVVIADVTDKGAASALFGAMTRMLLHELLARGLCPSEVMRWANLELGRQNPQSMFVTALLVEYTPSTGEGSVVSAGHEAPLVVRPSGEVRVLPVGRAAMPLAALGGTRYTAAAFALAPEETLLLFTDGVTEASAEGDRTLFGLPRLKALLAASADLDSRPLSERILAEVEAFQAGGEQADDITLVALKRRGDFAAQAVAPAAPTRSFLLELETDTASLRMLSAFVENLGLEAGMDPRTRGHFQVALEEIAMNLVMHGGTRNGNFQVSAAIHPDRLQVEVLDAGEPFDFDRAASVYEGVPDPDRPAGGVGLFLVRKFMDEVRYEPGTLQGNRLILVKRRTPPSS
jgi:phosphoserine phosphatase RsbU/P